MQSVIDSIPQLAAYHLALSALAILILAILIQSFLAGVLGLAGGEETAGMPLKGDHTKMSFRSLRTYANSTENLPAFTGTLLLAIIAGVGATLVNWLAVAHVAFRLIYWAIYYKGVGKVGGGVRTITYVLALLANIVLALATTYVFLV